MKLYGKKAALERIGQFHRSGRFPHALLFCGEKGIGKTVLADYTAMLRLCGCGSDGGAPCMDCKNCRRIEQHIHPDVIYPFRENEKYSVEQLRALITECCKAPNDGDLRVIVFEHLDSMNEKCQNTLLKFIEEPSAFNSCIFTAENKSTILKTILSRVAAINVSEAEKDECISALGENGISSEKAEELYGLYGGNIGKCLLAADGSDAEIFRIAAEFSDALCGGREYGCAVLLSAIKTREDSAAVLTVLREIFAKAAVLKSNGKISGAMYEQAERISRKFNLKTITELYNTASSLAASLNFNPNLQLFNAHCCAKIFSVTESGI